MRRKDMEVDPLHQALDRALNPAGRSPSPAGPDAVPTQSSPDKPGTNDDTAVDHHSCCDPLNLEDLVSQVAEHTDSLGDLTGRLVPLERLPERLKALEAVGEDRGGDPSKSLACIEALTQRVAALTRGLGAAMDTIAELSRKIDDHGVDTAPERESFQR